jgi:hypothetical protein
MDILSDKGFKHVDPGDAYSLGGSFVSFLIERYGYSKFGTFYHALAGRPTDTKHDYDVAGTKAYHNPIAHMIGLWRAALCRHGCRSG